MYSFAGAANHKLPQPRQLSNRNPFSHSSGVRDQGVSRFCLSWNLFPWRAHGHLLAVSSHGRSSVCTRLRCLSGSIFPLDIRWLIRLHQGPPYRLHFNFITFKHPISTYTNFLRHGVRPSKYGNRSQPQTAYIFVLFTDHSIKAMSSTVVFSNKIILI